MANRKGCLLATVAIALIVGGGSLLYFNVAREGTVASTVSVTDPANDATDDELIAAHVEYEFIWRDGDVRGVDIPTKIRIPSTGKVVPLRHVEDMSSLPGESKIAFLHRVRGVMATYSDNHSHEVCGEICSDGSAFSIRMTTNSAVTKCAVAPICLAGHTSLLESIHSHCPARGEQRATLADEYMTEGQLRKNKVLQRCDTERFSSQDLTGRRPGWLAGRRALHHHDGPARVSRHEADVAGDTKADVAR